VLDTTSKPRPVFIAALPREVSGLVNGWRADETLPARKINLYWNDDAIVACAGMGAARAMLAIDAALALGPASELISIGYAGACHPRHLQGAIILPDIVVDARTGERFFSSRERIPNRELEILVTVAAPAGKAEKQRLSLSYNATAVDMEATAVARAAQARDLPFTAIKGISDEADFELPDLAKFSTSDGQFREAAFALHVLSNPTLWKPVAALVKGSKLAGASLQAAVKEHIQQVKHPRQLADNDL
jgi:adenosylhomocysteine nucleosidase